MILGCILTIGVEFAAVSAGIDAIGKLFDGYSGGSESPRYQVPQEREESNEPPEKEREKRVGCEDRQYRGEHPLICGSEQSCIQECREHFSK